MSNLQPGHRGKSMAPWILFGVVLGMLGQASRLATGAQQFRSVAKLIVMGQPVREVTGYEPWREGVPHFAATIIETVGSDEIQRRALERTRALNPELKECQVDITVSQQKDSGIFNIHATGTDLIYIRVFLDALLDEFTSFRQAVRSQSQSRFFERLFEEFEKKRTAAVKAVPPDSTQALEQNYTEFFERLGHFKSVSEDQGDTAVIFERARVGASETQDWLLPLLAGAGLGAISGFLFFHLISMGSALRSLVAET